ncbi:MAG: BMP family ABC transporter substrate-binding protein [Jannaschia helgolandensis]|jgi:simple sugar transport system substrate-binding protein|uniref:Nucleoside-binding protein n=1 Tax=Jannaschia helgolandensis TaxID=188906 RepID=A0A1H7HL64_9RHOB|nr:BMP family ABC transporter substrate-binding protein [Jannaschia helgolandensis]SEK51156.1 nucleoside-binding protein [Jannaschia helgolandensis]|tara:strand:+ start:4605 stop:5696 length:1092 start_codon:yes stop_codon:yes gene_type:complete
MKLTTLLAGAMALGLSTPVLADAHDPVKVGFIYVGPIGDGGWTYQHDQGRLAVEAEYGDKVETVFQESVPEGADAERAITQMALGGADIIFTTSFGYGEATNAVAAKFPDVKFEHATGFMREYPNVSTYDARFYEGRAVTGTLAGYLTETNKIGYIGSFPIPEVIQGINASYLHAKKINPDVEMVVTWAYTWFDPAKEADAARAMIDQGVDVILQHTDSTAPQAAAQEANENGGRVFTFGQASDMAQFKPSPRVASIIDDWAPYYIERVGAVIDGTWEQQASWGGMPEGEVVIGEITDAVPAEAKAAAEEMIAAITAGEYHPFTGPINKQDGTPWLADGEVADDGTLAGMDFYVEGISGDIPN